MITMELIPIYDDRKSFWKKAKVKEEDGALVLYSYNTKVCFIRNNSPYILGFHSQTTQRHIKEFLIQNGFQIKCNEDMREFLLNR